MFGAYRSVDRHRVGDGPAGSTQNRPLSVGLLIPLSGPDGIWGLACHKSAILAASEINQRGGVLGRELRLVIGNAGGDCADVAGTACRMIEDDAIEAVIGMHISAVRIALVRALGGRVPYIYTPLYEGGEHAYGVFAVGETPEQQLRPALHWLAQERHARRWYLVGNDYVWPRMSHRTAKRYIGSSGGIVVGEDYLPFGQEDHAPALERIAAARPDAVLISMVGREAVAFNRSFAEHGLARHVLRLSIALDENVLLGIGAENAENLFSSAGYFTALRTDRKSTRLN